MNAFTLVRPKSFREAAAALNDRVRYSLPVIKAGGMDIVDHLKEGLISPGAVIDVKRLRPDGVSERDPSISLAQAADGSARLEIEATVTLTDIAESDAVRQTAPVLAQAAGDAASPQVRNVATVAGNLLQRPRCWYYRYDQFDCLKKGGSTCFAVDGENRYHAIFGRGPCYIVHPSNMALALHVLDAEIEYIGPTKDRDGRVSISDLYHLPQEDVLSEHNLPAGTVVTRIRSTVAPKSAFYAIKEKQSFDWPLVAAAVALEMEGETIRSARVCAGAVAPIPWALSAVEQALAGVSVGDEQAVRRACELAAEGASPLRDNGYKVKILPVAVRRAVLKAAGKEIVPRG